jgi:ATP synthase subunit 10
MGALAQRLEKPPQFGRSSLKKPMRTKLCLLALWSAILSAQSLPRCGGETLSGKKVELPDAAAGQPALIIIGFTHASQNQTRAWSQSVHNQFPVWSIAVLEEVPRLVRGMATHGIKSSVPREQYDHFLLVYHGEKELKQAAGFDQPDDAYLLVIDSTGAIQWRSHGAVTDAALDQIRAAIK